MTVVFVLLSKEYPMAETGWEEQLAAVAESVKGDETWAPLPGLLTVTPANAGLARKASRAEPMESLRSNFMKVTPYASIWVVQTGLKKAPCSLSRAHTTEAPESGTREMGRPCPPCRHRAGRQGKISVSY